MKKFSLFCIGEGSEKGKWVFEPYKGGMSVFDPDGNEVCWFPHAEANDCFSLPSFWRSIKHIEFTRDGSAVRFDPDRRSVAKLKDYLEEAIASQGAEAVERFRRNGWINVFIGALTILMAGGIIGVFYNFLGMRNRPGGYVVGGMILGGIGEVAWGISALMRARRVSRRMRAGPDDLR
jgi:hypothetical protein